MRRPTITVPDNVYAAIEAGLAGAWAAQAELADLLGEAERTDNFGRYEARLAEWGEQKRAHLAAVSEALRADGEDS